MKLDTILLPIQSDGQGDIYQEALAALIKLGINKANAEKSLAAIRTVARSPLGSSVSMC